MIKYKIAHVKIKGLDMVIVPLDAFFGDKRSEEKHRTFDAIQRSSVAAGLKGTVVLVWDCGGGKMAFLASKQLQSYLQNLTLTTIHNNLNKELIVKGLPVPTETAPPVDAPQAAAEPKTAPTPAEVPSQPADHRGKVAAFQRKHRIGLVTLLFTDMVGSTQLKRELGDNKAMGIIQKHHDAVREVLGRFPSGEEISTAGDSFFVVFARPSDAVKFSLQLQARLRRLSTEADYPIRDRIGIHVGEVFIEEVEEGKVNDLYGIQVDTCARVMSLAQGDQILMTDFAYENAYQVLKGQEIEGVGKLCWKRYGKYELKGVEGAKEICEVGEFDLAELTEPPHSEKAGKTMTGLNGMNQPGEQVAKDATTPKHIVGSSTSRPVAPIRTASIFKSPSD